MDWLRKTERRSRSRCRPKLESLETRTLLSVSNPSIPIQTLHTLPVPAQADSATSSSTPFDSITGASAARASFGVDGTGLAAAVIDMGVNYRHEALGGGLGSGFKVEAGYNFAAQTTDASATGFEHGTAVAGLIASDDPAHLGIAPGASLVPLKVFGDNEQGDFNLIANALQWVIDNHGKYNITIVNLSVSDSNNYTLNWYAHDSGVGERITTLIHRLDELSIPVVTAAGNSFKGQQGMGFAAIVADTISVTATDASDHLASDAQRLGAAVGGDLATDIAAPGVGLLAPAGGNNFAAVDGTSFSTALVSGAVILLQQIYEKRFGALPTVEQIDNWLKAGSDTVSDPATGIAIGRLDIPRAASLIPSPPGPASPPPVMVPPIVVQPSAPPAATPPVAAPAPPPSNPTPLPSTPTIAPTAAAPAPAPITPPVTQPTPPPQQKATPTTEVILNGQSLGAVSRNDAANSWSLYLSSFPLPETLDRVQIWTATGSQSIANAPSPSSGHAGARDHRTGVHARTDGVARSHARGSKAVSPHVAAAFRTAPSVQPGTGWVGEGSLRSWSRGLSGLVAAVKIRT